MSLREQMVSNWSKRKGKRQFIYSILSQLRFLESSHASKETQKILVEYSQQRLKEIYLLISDIDRFKPIEDFDDFYIKYNKIERVLFYKNEQHKQVLDILENTQRLPTDLYSSFMKLTEEFTIEQANELKNLFENELSFIKKENQKGSITHSLVDLMKQGREVDEYLNVLNEVKPIINDNIGTVYFFENIENLTAEQAMKLREYCEKEYSFLDEDYKKRKFALFMTRLLKKGSDIDYFLNVLEGLRPLHEDGFHDDLEIFYCAEDLSIEQANKLLKAYEQDLSFIEKDYDRYKITRTYAHLIKQKSDAFLKEYVGRLKRVYHYLPDKRGIDLFTGMLINAKDEQLNLMPWVAEQITNLNCLSDHDKFFRKAVLRLIKGEEQAVKRTVELLRNNKELHDTYDCYYNLLDLGEQGFEVFKYSLDFLSSIPYKKTDESRNDKALLEKGIIETLKIGGEEEAFFIKKILEQLFQHCDKNEFTIAKLCSCFNSLEELFHYPELLPYMRKHLEEYDEKFYESRPEFNQFYQEKLSEAGFKLFQLHSPFLFSGLKPDDLLRNESELEKVLETVTKDETIIPLIPELLEANDEQSGYTIGTFVRHYKEFMNKIKSRLKDFNDLRYGISQLINLEDEKHYTLYSKALDRVLTKCDNKEDLNDWRSFFISLMEGFSVMSESQKPELKGIAEKSLTKLVSKLSKEKIESVADSLKYLNGSVEDSETIIDRLATLGYRPLIKCLDNIAAITTVDDKNVVQGILNNAAKALDMTSFLEESFNNILSDYLGLDKNVEIPLSNDKYRLLVKSIPHFNEFNERFGELSKQVLRNRLVKGFDGYVGWMKGLKENKKVIKRLKKNYSKKQLRAWEKGFVKKIKLEKPVVINPIHIARNKFEEVERLVQDKRLENYLQEHKTLDEYKDAAFHMINIVKELPFSIKQKEALSHLHIVQDLHHKNIKLDELVVRTSMDPLDIYFMGVYPVESCTSLNDGCNMDNVVSVSASYDKQLMIVEAIDEKNDRVLNLSRTILNLDQDNYEVMNKIYRNIGPWIEQAMIYELVSFGNNCGAELFIPKNDYFISKSTRIDLRSNSEKKTIKRKLLSCPGKGYYDDIVFGAEIKEIDDTWIYFDDKKEVKYKLDGIIVKEPKKTKTLESLLPNDLIMSSQEAVLS